MLASPLNVGKTHLGISKTASSIYKLCDTRERTTENDFKYSYYALFSGLKKKSVFIDCVNC